MNKLLLGSAVAVLALAVSPAFAQDDSTLKLNLGGHFKGYGNYSSQDDDFTGTDVRDFDILRQTEVHFGGETTLDNGLTVGAQIETLADAGDSFEIDESYVYMAGSWGRINFGDEDGAAYLLQVAAPSADDNIDGIRQFIAPVNLGPAVGLAGGIISGVNDAYAGGLDYDNDLAGNSDKITYLTPVFSGFQGGFSYTPQVDTAEGITFSRGGNGNLVDDDGGFEDVVEAALRWEGSYNNVGMILGGGYTWAIADDNKEWNVGADFDVGPFGFGAIYTQNDYAFNPTGTTGDDEDSDTWVGGVDYTTGPFKLGASYLGSTIDDLYDANRFTGGVIYTYGPGMSFRGSVAYTDLDLDAAAGGGDSDAVTATVGTQINF